MLSICINSRVFKLFLCSLLGHSEFSLDNWLWRGWKSCKGFGSWDVTNAGGSCCSLGLWSDSRLGRRSWGNWALSSLDNRLCSNNWGWWSNSYWWYSGCWSSSRLGLDFSYWAHDLRLCTGLTNLLSSRWFLYNWFHELSKWWCLLFNNRELALLDCCDRFRKCLCRFQCRSWSNNWCLCDHSCLFLLSLDCHQFLSYILLELIHVEFWFLSSRRCSNRWLLNNSGNWGLNKSRCEDCLWSWLWCNLLNSKSWKWLDGWSRRSLSWFRRSRSRDNNCNISSLLLINCSGFGLSC